MNKKIVIVALDGYGASSRKISLKDIIYYKLKAINKVYNIDYNNNVYFRYERSRFASSRRRRIIKYLNDFNNEDHILLFIGKSYGAKVAEKIFNSITLNFYSTYIITIDPCWPKFFNWIPNCNDDNLFFKNPYIDGIYNIYLLTDKRRQAGSPVYSLYKDVNVINKKVYGYNKYATTSYGSITLYNHLNIIKHPYVSNNIGRYLDKVMKLGGII